MWAPLNVPVLCFVFGLMMAQWAETCRRIFNIDYKCMLYHWLIKLLYYRKIQRDGCYQTICVLMPAIRLSVCWWLLSNCVLMAAIRLSVCWWLLSDCVLMAAIKLNEWSQEKKTFISFADISLFAFRNTLYKSNKTVVVLQMCFAILCS